MASRARVHHRRVLTAGATSGGTSQGCRDSSLKSWSQALSAWQFIVGFRGILWGPFHSNSDCWVPCAMVANAATCNVCESESWTRTSEHDADLRNHYRAGRALAFAVAA
eukprot:299447-Chlamydomonas_euryale.AAC.3